MISHSRPAIGAQEKKAVSNVLQSQYISQGKQVVLFEKKLARLIGVRHAAAVSSGTAALHCALLSVGVAPGGRGNNSQFLLCGGLLCGAGGRGPTGHCRYFFN